MGTPADLDAGDVQFDEPHRMPPGCDVLDSSITMLTTIVVVGHGGEANGYLPGYGLMTGRERPLV